MILSAAVGLVLQVPVLAGQPVQVLSIHNGQQLLIEVNGQGRTLRLACLQAPRPSQVPWAGRAEQAMVSMVSPGAKGTFELRSRDVYGRLVGRLLVNGRDIGADLIRQGAVFAWDGFLGRCDDLNYSAIEAQARAEQRGLWSVGGGLPRPWDVMESIDDGEP